MPGCTRWPDSPEAAGSAMRLRGALFDFGGVLIDSPFAAFGELERTSGLPHGFIRSVNARDPDNNAWARIERGEIGIDEFCDLFSAEATAVGGTMLGGRLDARAVIDRVVGIAAEPRHAIPEMREAVESCRAHGLRIGLITNNVRPMREGDDPDWVFELFDVVVESCLVGARKPDPEIYRIACQAVAVEAHEVLMLDDLGINLKPARALGMHTIKVVDQVEAAAEVVRLLESAASSA